jgi:hypothetical protein
LTWRRLRNLLRFLPPESATMTAVRNANPNAGGDGDPSEGQWSQLELLVAMLLDETKFARWENAMSRLGKGDKRPKQPQPTPRPGVAAAKKKPPLPQHVFEFLRQHMNGGAPSHLLTTTAAGKGALNGVDQRR